MTRSQDLMFHLLMATLVASLVSRQFCPRPFYHAMALRFHKEVMHPHHRPSAGPANAAPPSGAQM